jgi:hypothetical protein
MGILSERGLKESENNHIFVVSFIKGTPLNNLVKELSGFKCRDISVILKFNLAPVFLIEILRSISSKNSAYLTWFMKCIRE